MAAYMSFPPTRYYLRRVGHSVVGDEPPGLSKGQRSPEHHHGGRRGTLHCHICGRNAGSYKQFSESESYLLSSRVKLTAVLISPCPALFSAATLCGRLNYFKLQCIKQGSSLILYYYVLVCTCGNSTACCLVTKPWPGSLLHKTHCKK